MEHIDAYSTYSPFVAIHFCQDTNPVNGGVGAKSFPSDLINPWCLVGISGRMNRSKPCDKPQLSRIMWWSCWPELKTILPSCSCCFFVLSLPLSLFVESNSIHFICYTFYLLYQPVCRIFFPQPHFFVSYQHKGESIFEWSHDRYPIYSCSIWNLLPSSPMFPRFPPLLFLNFLKKQKRCFFPNFLARRETLGP